MKRNILNTLLPGGALCYLLLTGCTSGLVEETVPKEAQLIRLSFDRPSFELSSATRAGGEEAEELPEGTTLRIVAYRRGDIGETGTLPVDLATTKPLAEATYVVDATGVLAPCQVDADGKKTNTPGAEPLAVRSGIYDFYAVSPARPLAEADRKWQIGNIPHKEDVMTSSLRLCNVTQAARRVLLPPFGRKCAQVVFTVSPTKGNKVPMDSLKGTALKLTGLSVSGAILPAGGSIRATGGGGDPAGSVGFETDEFVAVAAASDTAGLGLNKVTGIVLPKDGTPFDVSVTVQHNADQVTLRSEIGAKGTPILFEAGKRYIFTLQVENDQSRLILNVVPWMEVSLTDTNVGGGTGTDTDPEIDTGTSVGFVVAEWRNIVWNDTVGEGDKKNKQVVKTNPL